MDEVIVRKVNVTKNARMINLRPLLPDDWLYVKITVERREENALTLRIEKV